MLSTRMLATIVTIAGAVAWAGLIAGRWWDLLTAWLIWSSIVLWALIYELRRSAPTQPREDSSARTANGAMEEQLHR